MSDKLDGLLCGAAPGEDPERRGGCNLYVTASPSKVFRDEGQKYIKSGYKLKEGTQRMVAVFLLCGLTRDEIVRKNDTCVLLPLTH